MYILLAQLLAEHPIPTRTAALVIDGIQSLSRQKAVRLCSSGISIMSSQLPDIIQHISFLTLNHSVSHPSHQRSNLGFGFSIMTAYINAIGLFGTLLTTVGFIQGNVPSESDPAGATVRIKGKVYFSQITTPILIASLITDALTVGLEELGDDGASLISLHPTPCIHKHSGTNYILKGWVHQ